MKKPRVGDNPLLPFIDKSTEGSQAKAKAQAKAHAKLQAQPQAKAHAVKEQVQQGLRPGKLEDTRTRRTYWLTSEDIERIDQLAEEAGTAKHNIVGAAVELLHAYVFNEE